MNLGMRVEDDEATVLRNRRLLFSELDLDLERSIWCKQIHRDGVTAVTADDLGRGALDESDIIDETDAMVTDLRGVTLCVTLADCVPVAIYDPIEHVVGLAHAGWGGTVRRISSRTVAEMVRLWGCDPENLIAVVGPSIAPEDYEVGQDVIDAADDAYGEDSGVVIAQSEGKARFDLWGANRLDLESAGIRPDRIEVAGISTSSGLDDFYSYRMEATTGRFVTAVTLA